MKKIDKISFILFGILIGSVCVISIFVLGDFFSISHYTLSFKVNGYTEENALAICSGKDLKGTYNCLGAFISGIYKYKKTKDSLNIDFETLKSEGGDCRNWQILTCELAKKMGYACTKVTIPVETKDNIRYKHTFAIIHSSEGYAKFDGKDNTNLFIYEK